MPSARPRCDALVTATPGLALGVTGADCGMILFADQRARVIGAAHAGWKGALTGVVEATVAAMERLGARRSDIVAALGPCIGHRSYEVGPEFVAAFDRAGDDTARYFTPSRRAGHSMFNLNAYIAERAARAGVGRFEDLGPRHLRRRAPLLQLSPRHASEGAGLWPAHVGHRTELSREFGLLDRPSARDQLRSKPFCDDRRPVKRALKGFRMFAQALANRLVEARA